MRETNLSSSEKHGFRDKINKFIDNGWIKGILIIVIATLILNILHINTPIINLPPISISFFGAKPEPEQGDLSYVVKPPVLLQDTDIRDRDMVLSDSDIRVNNKNATKLYLRQIGAWNSGQIPISDFTMNCSFEDDILGSLVNVSPGHFVSDYGIKLMGKTGISCSLIRPSDGFTISFLTTGLSPAKVHSYYGSFQLHNAT